MKIYNIVYLICINIAINTASGSEVPVFVWGVNSDTLDIKPTSALELLTAQNFRNYVQKVLDVSKTTIIAFVQDKLSLEDLTVRGSMDGESGLFPNLQGYLDHQSSSVFPSVEDPAYVLEEMKGQYKVADINLQETRLTDSLQSVVDQSDIVIVHLPYAEIIAERTSMLQNNDNLIGKFLKSISGSKKNIVALYTGESPSWEQQLQSLNEPHVRVARQILAQNVSVNCTMPIASENCSLVYLENVDFYMTFQDNMTKNGSLSCPKSYVTECSPEGNDTIIIKMAFPKIIDDTSVLTLMFDIKTLKSNWYVRDLKLYYNDSNGGQVANLSYASIEAASSFSYSCGNLVLRPPSYDIEISGYVALKNFQIQPFLSSNDSLKFANSFDCVTFFTIPIWMGVFITISFTFILAVGIYVLFDVKTMDRFDDPKGKTISVPVVD